MSVTAVQDKNEKKKTCLLSEKGMRHIQLEIACLFIHFIPVLVHLISDNIAAIHAEQSQRKPFLVAALGGLSFSFGLQS